MSLATLPTIEDVKVNGLELQLISSEEIPLGATSSTDITEACPIVTWSCTSGNTYSFVSMCSTCC
ncbi:hypothetical protein ACFV4G_42990 [Kitasatospora sp. NPDC059747]|uniref:hypothetical protein n=1 Tax=Kitasatospora sp. NPDC059747 TaxID=3346930 RepID=UPI00365E046D